MNRFNRSRRRVNIGLSLLEMSISIAIAGAAAVLVLKKSVSDLRDKQFEREAQWIVGVLRDIQYQLGNSAGFSSLNDLTLGALTSVPPEYLDKSVMGTTKVINGLGGTVHVAPLNLDGSNRSYVLKYTGLTRSACSKLAVLLHTNAKVRDVPLFGMVGSYDSDKTIPGITLSSDVIQVVGTNVVLQSSSAAGLNMEKVGDFCDGAASYRGSVTESLRSLTLIRRP